MTSEMYQDSTFDQTGKGGKRPIRPKLLKLTDVTMPHRSRKKTKVKSKDRSQSTVRDRIYDDPAYTDDISHLAIPLRRSSVSVGGSSGGKTEVLGGSLGKRPKASIKQVKQSSSYEQDGSSSSDNMPHDLTKGIRGRSLERPEKSPKKRDTKRDRSSKQKRNLSLDNTQPGRRSLERGEASAKAAVIDRSYRSSKVKSTAAPKPSPEVEDWPEMSSLKLDTEDAFTVRGKESTKMQIGRKFLKGEIGIKSFNYYLLKEGLKTSKKFVEKHSNSLTSGLGSKKHISRSEENIYEEIFFKDRTSDVDEPLSQQTEHTIYPDCELCMQQCTKEDCEYCLQDSFKSKLQFGSLGRNDNRSSFAGSSTKQQRQHHQQQQQQHHQQQQQQPTQQQSVPAAHILEFQSYNPNNPGVYKIETTPVAITGEYNPILQFQQQPESQKQVPQQQQQPHQQHHLPPHHSLQQMQPQSHYQQPALPPIPQPRRPSRMPSGGTNQPPPPMAFIVGPATSMGQQMGQRVNNTKSSSSSDSLHHKYNTMARLEASSSGEHYHHPPPPNYRIYRLGGHLGGSQILPEPSYEPKIYKSDSKVSIISEYSARSSDNASHRNFRCGEVSDSSLGDSMFSYSTQQRRYYGSSESCRFAFECRRCSLDGEKCSFSDTCRYECKNCDCSSSYFSSDFDDLNYGRKSSSSQKSNEYFNESNLDLKQNKYAQDFFKHVNDVKRSIYQAEMQRTTVGDLSHGNGNGGHQQQQSHQSQSGRYQQGRASPFKNIKVPPAPPPSMYSTLPLSKDRVAARPSMKHNQPVPTPRIASQQQHFSSLRKQSNQHHQTHPLTRDLGEYASVDRVVNQRTTASTTVAATLSSNSTTGAIPKGSSTHKSHKANNNTSNSSNNNTKNPSPQPSPKLVKIKEKSERYEKHDKQQCSVEKSVTMENDKKIVTNSTKNLDDSDTRLRKKKIADHATGDDGRAGSTSARENLRQSDVAHFQQAPQPSPTLETTTTNSPQSKKHDKNPAAENYRLRNPETSGKSSPIAAITAVASSTVGKHCSSEQLIETSNNEKDSKDATAVEVSIDNDNNTNTTTITTIATLDGDEDDDVFYDARSEESLSVGNRRRKDQFHCTSSSITTPSSSPHNAATAPAATNPKRDPDIKNDAVPGPVTSPRLHKATAPSISCDTCCQLEESSSPTPTRIPSPTIGNIVANINSPKVECAPGKQHPQSPKLPMNSNSDGESSRKNSAQVNETIVNTTNGNTNSGDLLQLSTTTESTNTIVNTNNGSPTHHEAAATVVSDDCDAAPSSPTTITTTTPTTTTTKQTSPAPASPSPVTISVTTTSAEEAVAGNKANSELSRDSDITGVVAPVTVNRDLTPEAALRSPRRPPLSRQDYSCIDSTSEAASTDESHLTRDSRCSSNDRSSIPDKIDISNLPLPALPPKKRRSRSRPTLTSSNTHPLSSSITTPEENVKDLSPPDRTPYQKYAARRRESLEASTRSFNEKLEARKMHYHSLSQTSAASSSHKPTYLFGESRSGKKNSNEIFLNKSGWVQVNTKQRINNENSPGSNNRRTNYQRYDNQHNGDDNLKSTIRVIQIDNTGRDRPVYAVPKVSGSKIEELISRNEARRNTSVTRNYLKPGYKIVDPQIASILNERPGFLPVKSYLDSESPPPITPILSPPPAFQDSKAKYERTDAAVRVQITTSGNLKYDPNKVAKGGMVFSRSFEYDTRKTPKDNYVDTFSRSFDCNLSDKPPPQRDRSPNFSTLTGCSPNYLTKKENTLNKSRDNSPKYQQNLTTAYINTSVKEAPPVYSQPRKLEKAKSQFDRNGRSRKAQFSSRLQTSAGGMVAPPSIANMSRFRSFDTSISQRLNSCDSGARSDLSNDELDNEEDESTEFLTTNYHNISPYKQQRQRSLTPDRNDSHSSSSSLRKQRSITPESRSLTPEDRRKKGSQGSLSSRQNSGSRSNTLERNKKFEDKSRSASRSSSSSSYSGGEHDGLPSSTPHRRSNARNAKAAEDHRIRRSRSLQLTERSPNRSHKIMVCVGQPIPPNQPPIYHQSSLRSSTNSAFPPTIRTTSNSQQILVTNANTNRNTRSTDVDKSRSFDFDYGTYNNQNVPRGLDFVDKSRSFDEDFRESSNNNGNPSISMRYLQTTDVGSIRKVRKTSPVPSPQSSGTSSSTTLGPRQTSPQNYGTRLCDHELTYDMLRRSLDRSPIMDFSRDYDIPQSMKNRETINAGGNSELNFLSSSERIYDHPTTKRPNQSPSDSNYSLDRLHNSRDSITPDSAHEFKSIVTSDDRLRSEYLYRQQQQQRSHQGTNRGSSCTANTCDFWPHCGASYNRIVPNAKIQPQHQHSLQQHHHQPQQMKNPQIKSRSVEVTNRYKQPVKRQVKTSSVDDVPNTRGVGTAFVRTDCRKISSANTMSGELRGLVKNCCHIDNNRDGSNLRSNLSKTSIRMDGNSRSRSFPTPLSTSTVSIFLGDCEMPITREGEYHGSPTASGTSSGSGGRYGHSPSGEWTTVDGIRSRTSNSNSNNNNNNTNSNTSTKTNCTSKITNANNTSEIATTTATRERLRSVSLPNILNLSESHGYKLSSNSAVKTFTKGRASGGILYGIKTSLLKTFNYEEIEGTTVIKLLQKNDMFIVPYYINCNKWTEDYEKLNRIMFRLANKSVLVIGYLNARISNLQVTTLHTTINNAINRYHRNSKDTIYNQNGTNILDMLQMYDCTVLNGCTSGDTEGNYTFIGGQGKSVIDYCAINNEWRKFIGNFEVQAKNYSDHMPIVVEWFDNTVATERNLHLIPRLKWKQHELNLYQSNLDNNISLINNTFVSTESLSKQLIACIKNSTSNTISSGQKKFKNEWFDNECMKARRKSFHLLNAVRNSNSQNLRKWYIEENSRYKNLCLQKKTEYENQQAYSLGQTKDAKEFWKVTKKINGSNFAIGIGVTAEDLSIHFQNILCAGSDVKFSYAEPLLSDEILDSEITFAEINAVILKAKNEKAPGEDGVTYEFFKNGTEGLTSRLKALFNDILNKQEVPTSFKKAVIFPIHKKGDTNNVENYRGISFMNVIAKLFCGVLANRLEKWAEGNNIISKFQAGFRKNFSTVDHIFTLTSIVKAAQARNKKTYAFFVDFKSAFDLVNRNALFYKLSLLGMSTKFIHVIKEMYTQSKATVWDGAELSNSNEGFFM